MLIGYYSLANGVTLLGLALSLTSMFLATENVKFALYLLFLACICDMFDGTLARRKKRSPSSKFYGIQLDSLCDIVSFGVAPCFIAFHFGFNGTLDVIIYLIFVICGAIRLAHFNTLANENPEKSKKSFRGVPIPMSTFVITFLFLLTTFIPANVSVWLFRIILLLLAFGFILNIRVKKPDLKKTLILISAEIIMLLLMLIIGDCQAPQESGEASEVSEVSQAEESANAQ